MSPDKLSAANLRAEQLTEEARRAFADHVIRKRSEGRWLLMRPDKDGTWSPFHWTEVISLYGGSLYVGGDIQHVIFGYYSDDGRPESKVYWMGRRRSAADGYLQEKASIGSGRELTESWEEDVAREGVQDWLKEEREALGEYEAGDKWHARHMRRIEQLEGLLDDFPSSKDLLAHALYEIDPERLCDCGVPGTVPHFRLFYAHAALARLCDLLDAEKVSAAG